MSNGQASTPSADGSTCEWRRHPVHITLYPLWSDDPRVPASQFLGLVFPLEKFITHAAQRDSFLSQQRQQQQLFQQQQQQQQSLSMQSFADMRIPQPFNTSGSVYDANGEGLVNYHIFQNPIAPFNRSGSVYDSTEESKTNLKSLEMLGSSMVQL